MATFPSISPTYGTRKISSPKIRTTSFGDGYEFRALFGLPLTQDPKVSDGTLQVLNNNNITNFDVVFKDMFPTNLSTLDFNVTNTDNEFLTASVTFKYLLYEIRNVNTQTRR